MMLSSCDVIAKGEIMLEEEKVVNTEGSSASEESVVSTNAEDTAPVSPEQGTTEPQQHEDSIPMDRPVQNVEAEWQRKYSNLVEKLPTMIEEAVSKKNQPQQKEYTVAELEAYAIEHPEYRPWVEEQKEAIREKKITAKLEEQRRLDEQARKNELLRQQAEQEVVNDPRFADAFTTDARGLKVWNSNSKLTQLAANYLNEPELKGRPDAIRIAMKLARADLMDVTQPRVTEQLTSLKRQNTVLKQKTMPEGGGVPVQVAAKDSLVEYENELKKSGTEAAAQKYVAEYMKRLRNK